ncbi:hypothetical protein G3I44_16080 [Halogeometricum borinquense]|uniref:Uncharacterized protein n=2 Tax=Halogeometricum borinquense TaxID=60847 RepID=E4NUT0_HALBP|nr:hypothetical protein [Halogeometricum borinquense]ADQ68800.1 hypothetical protein Hbor_32690 [Halogeometricum borinquense DSM 11551]ELY25638.1 hypothetical protein C499_14185 [Halogeometricum borinquense DSM 11551]QIB75667.1 hypothetical protein G3I44_16080 [Halogeometricum borinquense]RYJ08492.1 hypothetical protein ELS19_18380 [Halogeometricum borinquense]
MDGECYFCHGLVLPDERDDILLADHAEHRVFLHEECARGYELVDESDEDPGDVKVTCPECGAVEIQ